MHLEQSLSPRYNSMLKIMIPENLAEKPPPPEWKGDPVRDPAHITHGEYPWSSYYKSTLRLLLSKYLSIGYQLCQLFKILTYTEIQDTRS